MSRMVCDACWCPYGDDGKCGCNDAELPLGATYRDRTGNLRCTRCRERVDPKAGPCRCADAPPSSTTLPTDSAERKSYPLHDGCLAYFPAALAGVARHSKAGNDKHNPGEPLHHARGKSMDHKDCILRHLVDLGDLLAARNRQTGIDDRRILDEVNALAWRALALSQELHERMGGAPLAPGAR